MNVPEKFEDCPHCDVSPRDGFQYDVQRCERCGWSALNDRHLALDAARAYHEALVTIRINIARNPDTTLADLDEYIKGILADPKDILK